MRHMRPRPQHQRLCSLKFRELALGQPSNGMDWNCRTVKIGPATSLYGGEGDLRDARTRLRDWNFFIALVNVRFLYVKDNLFNEEKLITLLLLLGHLHLVYCAGQNENTPYF